MDYKKFKELVGNLTVPNSEQKNCLLESKGSIHFLIHLGTVVDGEYVIDILEPAMEMFADILNTINSRGAIREKDYMVCGDFSNQEIKLGIHTTHKFLSDEDFSLGIRRLTTK